jgi:hypothetical protein
MEINHKEILNNILHNALKHMDAISIEMNKIIKDGKIDSVDPEVLRRARMMDLTMIAINDIIHPAHNDMELLLPHLGPIYANTLRKAYEQANAAGMLFKGCTCGSCKDRAADELEQKAKENK